MKKRVLTKKDRYCVRWNDTQYQVWFSSWLSVMLYVIRQKRHIDSFMTVHISAL